jgi:aminocarboxymuconate-semialdehyde decarboxylase
METVPAIDIHAHYYPDAFLKLVEGEGASFNVRLSRDDPAGPVIEIGSVVKVGPLRRAFIDLDIRRKEMNRQGVQVHALSLTLPMVYWADADLGVRLARATNDAMAEAHTAFPERFLGLATLPMQEPARALLELNRVARLPGMRGIYLGTNVAGRELSDEGFFPIYARAQELRWPILLHPLNVIGAQRLSPYYLHNLLGNPFDTAIAAAQFVFGGVLDRFPRLTICLPHAGGAFPYLVGRLDRGWRKRPECRRSKRRPSAYLRRFTYDTIGHAAEPLRYLIRLVGADRVMLGSDYCFDMGYERPVQVITGLRTVSVDDKARILGANAARLLRIPSRGER